MNKLKELIISEDGASLGEFALLLGIITVTIVTVIVALGDKIEGAFNTAISNIPE